MNLAALLSVAVLAAVLPAPPVAPSPAPSMATSPAPADKPLKDIGSVRATTPYCRKMIEVAVNVVDLTLTNDVKIAGITATLRTIDLDANQLVKHRGTEELRKRYASLRAAAVQGERALRQFKADAKAATDPEQRAALEKFADALSGALYRQQKLADNLGGYIAFLDASEPLNEDDRDELRLQHDINASNPAYADTHNAFLTYPDVPETLSHSAKRAADEFETRALPINKDEDDAANRIDPAFRHC